MTKPPKDPILASIADLCLPPCIPQRRKSGPEVYIVVENLAGFGAVPHDMTDIFHGVFLTAAGARECLHTLARRYHRTEGVELIVDAGAAQDARGVCLYQIVVQEVRI